HLHQNYHRVHVNIGYILTFVRRPQTDTLFPYTTLFRSWPRASGSSVKNTGTSRSSKPSSSPSPSSSAEPRPVSANPAAIQRRSADRKSTRLNSSHVKISYAVFCLKKKKKK